MDLRRLPAKPVRAVVINCSTRLLSTLAVASVLRHTPLDVLLVDCESTDGSFDWFESLRADHGGRIEVVALPLRPHGTTLDHILRTIPSERVLLVDSDLEILAPGIMQAMVHRLDAGEGTAYGAGLLHAGGWMGRVDHGVADGTTYFMERMWIPLVLLDVPRVRTILDAGASFLACRSYRSTARPTSLAALWAKRFRLPLLRDAPGVLDVRRFDPGSPSVREYDTGARVHEQALAMGMTFSSIDGSHWADVHHLDGATRALHRGLFRRTLLRLGWLPAGVETSFDDPGRIAAERLAVAYPGFLSIRSPA